MNILCPKIFVIQHERDYDILGQYIDENSIVFSFSPFACYILEKNNIKYIDALNLFDQNYEVRQALNNFFISKNILLSLSVIFKNNNKIINSKEVDDILVSFDYYLRNIIDYAQKFTLIIEIISKKYPTATFNYVSFSDFKMVSWVEFLNPISTYYSVSYYLETFFSKRIKTKKYNAHSIETLGNNEKSRDKLSVIANKFHLYLLSLLGNNLFCYELPKDLLMFLNKNGFGTHQYKPDFKKQNGIQNDSSTYDTPIQDILNEYSIGDNNNFITTLSEALRFIFSIGFKDLRDVLLKVKEVIKKNNIKAAIFISPSTPKERVLLTLFKQYNIPTVNIQHGGAWGYFGQGLAEVFYSDLSGIDYFFAFGSGVQTYIENNYKKYIRDVPKIIVTGSKEIYKIENLEQKKEASLSLQNIFYVPTSFNLRRNLWHYYPENYYYLFQKKLIDYFVANTQINFYYKDHYKGQIINPIPAYIKDKNCKSIKIINEKFSKVLDQADMFIVDSPTTTFLEAAVTNKLIVLYWDTELMPIEKYSFELIKKRAEVFTKEIDLFNYLDKLFIEKTNTPNNKCLNREFIDQYGCPREILSPDKEMIKTMREIIKK